MNAFSRLCRRALCAPIRFYKRFLSAGLGFRKCRFTPSCSSYAIEAIEKHGCVKGTLLAAWRLLRCQPFAKWGFDPVPEKGQWKNPKRVLYPPRGFSTRKK